MKSVSADIRSRGYRLENSETTVQYQDSPSDSTDTAAKYRPTVGDTDASIGTWRLSNQNDVDFTTGETRTRPNFSVEQSLDHSQAQGDQNSAEEVKYQRLRWLVFPLVQRAVGIIQLTMHVPTRSTGFLK